MERGTQHAEDGDVGRAGSCEQDVLTTYRQDWFAKTRESTKGTRETTPARRKHRDMHRKDAART